MAVHAVSLTLLYCTSKLQEMSSHFTRPVLCLLKITVSSSLWCQIKNKFPSSAFNETSCILEWIRRVQSWFPEQKLLFLKIKWFLNKCTNAYETQVHMKFTAVCKIETQNISNCGIKYVDLINDVNINLTTTVRWKEMYMWIIKPLYI